VKVRRFDRDPSAVDFCEHVWARWAVMANPSIAESKRAEKSANLFDGSLLVGAHRPSCVIV